MARQLAAPLREHAAAIAERHALASAPDWHLLPTSGDRPGEWKVMVPPHADGLLLEAAWQTTGHAALVAPAARIGIAVAGRPRSAILQADPSGAPVPMVIRLDPAEGVARPGDSALLTITSTTPQHPVELASLRMKWLHGGLGMAVGAGGIIVPGVENLEEGLREFVDHADHYLRTAARLAPSVRSAHAPSTVLETLLA